MDKNKMKIEELEENLETLRAKYKPLELKQNIAKMLDRIIFVDDLEDIYKYVEGVYKRRMIDWGFLYGMRDNIKDMADNLADMQDVKTLQYLNEFMYCALLMYNEGATIGLHTCTEHMQKAKRKHIEENVRGLEDGKQER